MPRAVFVQDWQPADFDDLVKTGRWPAFDPYKTVLLDSAPPSPDPDVAPDTIPDRGYVEMTTYENTVVEIEVVSASAGYVVLNDVWHPWWHATVDGKATDVLKANVMFRAVQVPAGRHVVRFEFQPLAGAVSELTEHKPTKAERFDLMALRKKRKSRPHA
jgi:hypothetical protein